MPLRHSPQSPPTGPRWKRYLTPFPPPLTPFSPTQGPRLYLGFCMVLYLGFSRVWGVAEGSWCGGERGGLAGGRARPRPKFSWCWRLGVKPWREFGRSGGGGRSGRRPGVASRACRVDRSPALFSHAEENPRPHEPVYSSSTGEGTGSGDPDRKLTARRQK